MYGRLSGEGQYGRSFCVIEDSTPCLVGWAPCCALCLTPCAGLYPLTFTLSSAAPVRIPCMGPHRSASQVRFTTLRTTKIGPRPPGGDGREGRTADLASRGRRACAQSLISSPPAAHLFPHQIEEAAEVRPSPLRAQHIASLPAVRQVENPSLGESP